MKPLFCSSCNCLCFALLREMNTKYCSGYSFAKNKPENYDYEAFFAAAALFFGLLREMSSGVSFAKNKSENNAY